MFDRLFGSGQGHERPRHHSRGAEDLELWANAAHLRSAVIGAGTQEMEKRILENVDESEKLAEQKAKDGQWAEALDLYQSVLKTRWAALGSDSLQVADTQHNIGICYSWLNKYDAAMENMQQALKTRRKKLGKNHLDVAATIHNIGTVQTSMGNDADALKSYEEVLRIQKHVRGEDSISVKVAHALCDVGHAHLKLNHGDEAIHAYETSLAIYRKNGIPDDHPDVACIHHHVASKKKE